MDLASAYRRSVAEFTDLVRQVGPGQWSGPTPCAAWDVRDLVNHLVYEQRWAVPLFAGATLAEVGDQFEGDLLGADPVAAAEDAARQAQGVADPPGALDRTVHLSFGDTPAREYLYQLTADHLVHAWDLAVAIGADPARDPQVVGLIADWFTDRERLYRASGVTGPAVPVPADAPVQDRLIGAFGRDPGWSPGAGRSSRGLN